MQSQVPGIIISAEVQEERTDAKTGEVYKAQGTIHLLVSEKGEPQIKKVKCSVMAARKYAGEGMIVGQPVQSTSLMIDSSEYKLADGRQGVSTKLVETDDQARQRGTFKIGAPVRVAPPVAGVNGQVPALAGSR